MSKTDKMRGKLLSVQKDREEFEKQKKQLEEQMHIGKQNIGRIQKGLKNNDINKDSIVIEQSASFGSPDAHSKQGKNASSKKEGFSKSNMSTKSVNDSSSSMNSPQPTVTETFPSIQTQLSSVGFIPLGTRISDWCYTGSLDSAPPVVKADELYDLVRHIGRGSYGDVNLVKNTEDSKLFAIKSMFCPKESDYVTVLREVRYLRAHRHPCIIDVVDAFVISNPRVVHIVMPYCESGNLSTVIATAKRSGGGTTPSFLPENQIMKWMLQLCLALQFLHENSILHRDIKPMNIMLTEGGDLLKLGDFGLALDMKKSKSSELVDEAGTPYYTAPEMILREQYSFPADCWSIGVVLFQLLALYRPFDGDSAGSLVKAILNEEPAPLPHCYSEEIRKVCRELLQKNQLERLAMNKLLIEPCFYSKTVQFATSYRPKTLDDRSRRVHIKQLETQVEVLMREMRLKQQLQQQQLIERQLHLQHQLALTNPNPNPNSFTTTHTLTHTLAHTLSPVPPTSSLSSANLLANNAAHNASNNAALLHNPNPNTINNTIHNTISNTVSNAVSNSSIINAANSLAANTLANKGVNLPTMASFKAAHGNSTRKLHHMGSSKSVFSSASDAGSCDYNDDDGYFDEAMNPFDSDWSDRGDPRRLHSPILHRPGRVHLQCPGKHQHSPAFRHRFSRFDRK